MFTRPCVFGDHLFEAFRAVKLIKQPTNDLHFKRSTFCDTPRQRRPLSIIYCYNLHVFSIAHDFCSLKFERNF